MLEFSEKSLLSSQTADKQLKRNVYMFVATSGVEPDFALKGNVETPPALSEPRGAAWRKKPPVLTNRRKIIKKDLSLRNPHYLRRPCGKALNSKNDRKMSINKNIVATAGFAPALTLHLSGSKSALPCCSWSRLWRRCDPRDPHGRSGRE